MFKDVTKSKRFTLVKVPKEDPVYQREERGSPAMGTNFPINLAVFRLRNTHGTLVPLKTGARGRRGDVVSITVTLSF